MHWLMTAATLAIYLAIAIGIIVWKINATHVHASRYAWPVFRRNGFRRDDLDASIAFGLVMLVFNAGTHAVALSGVVKPAWLDFAGATTIGACACGYLWLHRRTSGLRSFSRRAPIFFGPMLLAMAADQYLAKLALFFAWLRNAA